MIPVDRKTKRPFARRKTTPTDSPFLGRKQLRIGILSNLRAGQSDKHVPRLRSFLTAHPDVVSAETHSADDVPEVLTELANQDIGLLMVYGGDGTLQHVLTEILGRRRFGDRIPMIAPLRGGRTNMTALEIGTQRDPIKCIASIIKAVETGKINQHICPRHILHMASKQGDVDEYGMIFGTGTVYNAIELVQRSFPNGRAQGVFGAGVVMGGLLFRRAIHKTTADEELYFREKVQIILDGKPVEQEEYLLVLSSTLRRIFLHVRPFWGEGPGPARFTCTAAGARRFALAIPRLLTGKPGGPVTPENGYNSRNIHRAELQMDCGFVIDGELYAPQDGRILTITADDRIDFVRA